MSFERLHQRCGCGLSHGSEGGSSLGRARPFAFRETTKKFEKPEPFRTLSLSGALRLDLTKKTVSGTVRLSLERVDPKATALELDAVGFSIQSVAVGDQQVPFTYDGQKINLEVGKETHPIVSVTYSVAPRRGMYFLQPDEKVPKRPRQVWTQCQEEDARYFLPCHDSPSTKFKTEFEITVPKGFAVLSNGELVRSDCGMHSEWKYVWRMNDPIPTYLITIVAGEFEIIEGPKTAGVPLQYYVPKGGIEDGKRTFERTPEMVKFFGQKTGLSFPWNKYAQVVVSDFIFGGMENTTATTMYEHILLDKKSAVDITSDDLIAHELAHHWFGDYVTCRDWSEGWLNEGFATFFEHVWREHLLGEDEYYVGVQNDLDAYMAEASGRYRRPIVCRTYEAPLDLFDRHLYEKGGLVLHLLRRELGDEAFWKGVALYLRRHAHSTVETRDLQRAFEESSGRGLSHFFDQWVYSPGHPDLSVKVDYEDGLLSVSVEQTQSTEDGVTDRFSLPVVLELAWGEVRETREFHVTKKSERFVVPMSTRPTWVVVDPELRVLGSVRVEMANDWLRLALTKAPTARGRMLAAKALSTAFDRVSVEALLASIKDEKEFWRVRAAAADSVATIRGPEALEGLVALAKVSHPKVRRAVVRALGAFRSEKAFNALVPLAQQDESYLVEAEALRAIGRTRQPRAWTTLTAAAERPSWSDVVAAAAIDGMVALRDERAEPILIRKGAYGFSSRVRRAAIEAIPKLLPEKKAREVLIDWLDDSDPHLRIDLARALEELADPRSRGALAEQLSRDLDPRVRRVLREVLRDLGQDGRSDVRELKEELEKIRGEWHELRTRLSKLEADDKEHRATAGAAPAKTAEPKRTKSKKSNPPPAP